MSDIESLLHETRSFKPDPAFARAANWNKKTVAEYRKAGRDNPEKFWAAPNKKPRLGGAGTLIRMEGADYAVSRGSHGGSSRLLPHTKAGELDAKVESIPENNGTSFAKACMGEGKTWSPFSVSAELTQVLMLGCIAQYLNTDLVFDPKTKTITNNAEANARLSIPPRKGWETFYKMV